MKLHRLVAAAVAAGILVTGPALIADAQTYGTLDTGVVADTTPIPGQTMKLRLTGLQPFSTVTVMLHSDPVALGTFTADANGELNVDVTVPTGTPFGNHSIVATGIDAEGNPVTSTIPVTVTSTDGTTTPDTGGGGFLPRTGADVAALLSVGGVLIAVGGVSVVAARRRIAESR